MGRGADAGGQCPVAAQVVNGGGWPVPAVSACSYILNHTILMFVSRSTDTCELFTRKFERIHTHFPDLRQEATTELENKKSNLKFEKFRQNSDSGPSRPTLAGAEGPGP